MTGTGLALPTTSDDQSWDDETRALMASAGLVHRDYDGTQTTAPRSVVASFLHQCTRSGLDPLARQIYLIARKNQGELVWSTQVSIDGLRLIAERSGHYAGQGDVEWLTAEGQWVDVWLPKYGNHPAGARATVYRDDFKAPLRAIALWDSYVQTKRDGNPTSMWKQHGPGQIAKCAEALALRKAFPQDLSGLYTPDEMQQAEVGRDGTPSITRVHPGAADVDEQEIADSWAVKAAHATTRADALELYREAKHRGFLAYATTTGEFLGEILLERGRNLAAEEAQAAAGEPEPQPDYDENELV
jgi:phage recombination protein Bet